MDTQATSKPFSRSCFWLPPVLKIYKLRTFTGQRLLCLCIVSGRFRWRAFCGEWEDKAQLWQPWYKNRIGLAVMECISARSSRPMFSRRSSWRFSFFLFSGQAFLGKSNDWIRGSADKRLPWLDNIMRTLDAAPRACAIAMLSPSGGKVEFGGLKNGPKGLTE